MLSVLALELDGKVVRAAVVKRTLRDFEVTHTFQLNRTEGSDTFLAPEELELIIARLAECPRWVVVVTPRVEMMEITMEAQRTRKMKTYQLREAVRWEAEPYTTYPAAESLVGCEIGFEAADELAGIWVTMFPEDEYTLAKRTLEGKQLKLQRAFPPDVCFSTAAARWDPDPRKIAVDLGLEAMRFAYIEEQSSIAYRMLPYGLEVLQEHISGRPNRRLVEAVQEVFATWGGRNQKVVLTGAGALDEGLYTFFRKEIGVQVTPLLIPLESGENAAPFASAVGAGLRQLYLLGGWKDIGVSDRVELSRLLRERAYLYPLVAAGMVVVIFLGHYWWLNHQIQLTEEKVALLQEEQVRVKELKEEASSLEGEKKTLEIKQSFLEQEAAARLRELEVFFAGIKRAAPFDLEFKEIKPLGGDLWSITGETGRSSAVQEFALRIQDYDWCEHTRIVSIERKKDKQASGEDAELFTYNYTLEVLTRGIPGAPEKAKKTKKTKRKRTS